MYYIYLQDLNNGYFTYGITYFFIRQDKIKNYKISNNESDVISILSYFRNKMIYYGYHHQYECLLSNKSFIMFDAYIKEAIGKYWNRDVMDLAE